MHKNLRIPVLATLFTLLILSFSVGNANANGHESGGHENSGHGGGGMPSGDSGPAVQSTWVNSTNVADSYSKSAANADSNSTSASYGAGYSTAFGGGGIGTGGGANLSLNQIYQQVKQYRNNPNLASLYAGNTSSAYGCQTSAGGGISGMGAGLNALFPFGGDNCFLLHMIDKLQVQANKYGNLKMELIACRAQEKANGDMQEARNDPEQAGGIYTCFMEYTDNLKAFNETKRQMAQADEALKQAVIQEDLDSKYGKMRRAQDELMKKATR